MYSVGLKKSFMIFTWQKESLVLWMLVHCSISYDISSILFFFSSKQKADAILGEGLTERKWEPFVKYSGAEGKCMLFFSFIIYMSWEAFKSQQPPNSSMYYYYYFLHLHGKNNKFQRQRVENQPLWCENYICVWAELHLRWQALWSAPLPSYTLALIASLFCV